MRITVYNAKGGAGKTPISVNIALEHSWAIGTNEPFHVLDEFIPDDRLMAIRMEEEFPPIPDDIDIVFDLAGSISAHSNSISSAIRQSDLIIVPIFNEVKSLVAGAQTVKEVAALNPNILVVATKLEKGKGEFFDDWADSADCRNIQSKIAELGFDFPVLPLKKSTAFDRIFEDELSINQLMENDGALRYSFRDVARQFDKIFEHIEELRHGK